MQLIEIVQTSQQVAETGSRLAKINAIASTLSKAQPEEIPLVVSYLSGTLPQRRPGIGWASLRSLPEPAEGPTLELTEVDGAFTRIEAISGAGSAKERTSIIDELFRQATESEQAFLVRLIGGELRQGALAGVMTAAIAKAAAMDIEAVRQAAMLTGSLSETAGIALTDGEAGLSALGVEVGRPLQPMLAQSAPSIDAAMEKISPAIIEYKLDGVRIQAHKYGDTVAVFTRTLDEVTTRVPEIVECVSALDCDSIILDGEAICLRDDGRPRPFQETGSRIASQANFAQLRRDLPLTPYFFDLLYLNNRSLLNEPSAARYAAASAFAPVIPWVPRIEATRPEDAAAFLASAINAGHEGVVVKDPDGRYEAGRRGGAWIKVKPHHTLDLVVLAAEWGHGRRTGKLSNLHLGARSDDGETFIMLGKTFKGLTDTMLAWQTEALLAREGRRTSQTVYVRPELVVEVAFDGLQASTRYPGGLALRFARVIRYREDKTAEDADTMETVRDLQRS